MNFLTNDKLVIVGAGGMIGSNMVQSALMLGLTPNICLYDIFEPGVHGVFDEIQPVSYTHLLHDFADLNRTHPSALIRKQKSSRRSHHPLCS